MNQKSIQLFTKIYVQNCLDVKLTASQKCKKRDSCTELRWSIEAHTSNSIGLLRQLFTGYKH